jgi:gamma-glutamylcyclotransferase (GGCT)/AIG2-like uncharacterized protein YtfP
MKERIPNSKPLFTATLPNYQLIFTGWSRTLQGGSASIKLSRGNKVIGAIYEISEQDIRQLDRYEGLPNNYMRIDITVYDEAGNQIKAFTYIKKGKLEETKPSQRYLQIIQKGYKDWRLI